MQGDHPGRKFSVYTWFRLNPAVQAAAMASSAAAGWMIAQRGGRAAPAAFDDR